MDMADRKGEALRRRLVSAERFKDLAILRGLSQVKTAGSRSMALLVRVTSPDQYRRAPAFSRFIPRPP